MEHKPFADVGKIAVFRATALGDLVFALPALQALRAAYPLAEIVYLGREWHTTFLPGRLSGAHRVIAVPPAATLAQIEQGRVIDPAVEADFLAQMRGEGFDLAVQMHGAGEYSNPFVLALGARHSVGLKSPRAVALDRWMPYIYYQHEVVRALEVAALAGANPLAGGLLPRLPLLVDDRRQAEPVLAEIGAPFAVLHPGSTDPRRCWDPRKFAALGDALAGQGLRVALTGTRMDAERIESVAAQMRAPSINLCDRLGLAGLLGLLSRAALFVGNDTGPLHLALAVGAKAVAPFWVEYVINSLPLPRAAFTPLVAWRRDCPACGAYLDKAEIDRPSGSCTHAISLLDEISAGQMISAALDLLAAG